MKTTHFNLGYTVLCDYCNTDFTDSSEQGGLMFGSKAVCPRCAPKLEEDAKRYNETHFIRERCPEGVSFKDFVIFILRGGFPGRISVTVLDPGESLDDVLKKQIKNQ
jgi:hypothetical protein